MRQGKMIDFILSVFAASAALVILLVVLELFQDIHDGGLALPATLSADWRI
jgi:hypothetical protein